MATSFPNANDTFRETLNPEIVPLSSAGTGDRNHIQHHTDLGDAIEAIQANVPLLDHDHSGSGSRPTSKLRQINTHESADTDSSASALHHTLGGGQYQAAAGNHNHSGGANGSPIPISSVSSLEDRLQALSDRIDSPNDITMTNSLGRKIALNATGTKAIGSQNSYVYLRTPNGIGFYRGGSHTDTDVNAGSGGSILAYLNASGTFFANRVYAEDSANSFIAGPLSGSRVVIDHNSINSYDTSSTDNGAPLQINYKPQATTTIGHPTGGQTYMNGVVSFGSYIVMGGRKFGIGPTAPPNPSSGDVWIAV